MLDLEKLIKAEGWRIKYETKLETNIKNINAGKILLARLTKKFLNEKDFFSINSLKIIEQIKYPEITKKISTPKNPPLKITLLFNFSWVWYMTTEIIDINNLATLVYNGEWKLNETTLEFISGGKKLFHLQMKGSGKKYTSGYHGLMFHIHN